MYTWMITLQGGSYNFAFDAPNKPLQEHRREKKVYQVDIKERDIKIDQQKCFSLICYRLDGVNGASSCAYNSVPTTAYQIFFKKKMEITSLWKIEQQKESIGLIWQII